MMTNFQREKRYIVIKKTDLEAIQISLAPVEKQSFNNVLDELAKYRDVVGKAPLECVVVEKDWPEFELVWKLIEARMTGTQYPDIKLNHTTEELEQACENSFSNGVDAAHAGVQKVWCNDDTNVEVSMNIEWFEARSDSSVGIPDASGWTEADDQTGTELGLLRWYRDQVCEKLGVTAEEFMDTLSKGIDPEQGKG
jgi:hypothetical protein